MKSVLLTFTALITYTSAFTVSGPRASLTSVSRRPIKMSEVSRMGGGNGGILERPSTTMLADNKEGGNKKGKEPEKEGLDRIIDLLQKAEDDKNSDKPPIYEPGPYPYRLLSCLPYLVPIADSFDLGKYMFEAFPDTLAAYNTLFGAIAGIYNGVPFLPFAVFFLLSYIARAPTFPVETRFHASQAFMLSILQFPASVLFPIMEKAGVPGMAVLFNTVFLWVMTSSVFMQLLLINPVSSTKNPFVINIVGWAMRYMGYQPDPNLKR